MKSIIIMGPPGSGKDTQIEELEKTQELVMVSGGDIARNLSAKNKKYQAIIDEGNFLDDDLILAEVDREVAAVPDNLGIIFDGIPRTLHQAEKLNEILSHNGRTLDAVIYIELEEEKIIDRLSRRRVCSICGKNLPSQAEKCIDCGGRPTQRPDDQPATIMKRVQTFLDRTLPLVNYYQNKGIIAEIDGDQTVVDVAKDIKEKLASVERR